MAGTKAILPLGCSPPILSDFVIGQNRELLSALKSLVGGESREHSVYLWGEPGGGKTHLLRAAAAEARKQGRRAFFCQGDDVPPPMAGLLAIDNICAANNATQIAVFDWYNTARQSPQYSVLASGGAPPSHLPLREELTARLGGGLVFQLRRLSDGEKIDALRGFAARHGFALPEEIANLFLTRLPRDMCGLAGALSDLDKFLLGEQMPLNLQNAHRWLDEYHQRKNPLL